MMRTLQSVETGLVVRACAAGVALAGLAGGVRAQTITELYHEGDTISMPDSSVVGAATAFNGVSVNDGGSHLVEIDTDGAAASDVVVTRNFVVIAREGDPVAARSGVTATSFDSVHLNSSGNVAWNRTLAGTGSTSTDSALMFGQTLVLQESFVSLSPGFGNPTPYIGFFEVLTDDSNDFLVMASVDDPNLASTVDRAVVVFDYDPNQNTFVENVLIKEGDTPTGLAGPITDFGTTFESMSRSSSGNHLMLTLEVSGGTGDAVWLDGSLVAREGDQSPISGRNYRILNDVPIDVNNNGEYVIRAILDGDTASDTVILKNGTTVIAQEGGSVPGVPGFSFTGFGSGGVFIGDDGNVIWFGDWDDPDTTRDRGIFRNNELVLQEGVTDVNGNTVVEILGVSDGYDASPSGRYVIVKVRYAASADGVVLIDFGATTCVADVDDGSGTGTPDGGVTIDDLLYYLAIFNAGSVDADVDNGTGTGTTDGGVTIDDLLYYLARFNAGC